jgi:tRNA nucleotidyltransferase (CCA-adding enzyme)
MKVYLVGGAIRDSLLGLPFHERDWVVVGATKEELTDKGYKQIGKDFPVFLHPETKEEYALARKERKTGSGHKAFSFEFDRNVSLEEDLERRDITINAIAQDENGNLIDPYNGQQDIEDKIIRKVSSAFKEDPLRVLRVARFAAKLKKLGFTIEEDTKTEIRNIVNSGELKTLSKERIWMETHKALETDNPETYFDVINECSALNQICALNSIDTNYLSSAGKEETDTAFRWACLVSPSALVEEINNSFNAPKEFKEISVVCNQIIAFKGLDSISAEDIIELADKTDIYRKEERFLKAAEASTFCAKSNYKKELNWKNLVKCINDIKASTDLKEGNLIAKKLKEDRLEAIQLYLSKL